MTKLREMAEECALKYGAMLKPRTDGLPITFANLKAVAEVSASCGFTDGFRAAIELAAQIADNEGRSNAENPFIDPMEYGRRRGINWASEWIARKTRALGGEG